MDSVFDRAGEGVVYVGIAAGCVAAGLDTAAILAAAAMAPAFMVSYVRAKSESLGFTPGSRMAAVGLAPREVRLVILTVGLCAVGGVASSSAGYRWSLVRSAADPRRLALITILATITTIQRILHVVRQSSSKEHQ